MSLLALYNGTLHTGLTVLHRSTILVENGRIKDVMSNELFEKLSLPEGTKVIDLKQINVSPGLIDTHIHGVNGAGTEDGDPESILKMSASLPRYGVTAFLPTLYPMEENRFIDCIKAVREAKGNEQGARIFGMHLEGPFISPSKLGVQKPDTVRAIDVDFMERLWQASGGSIRLMTVAPELKGLRELALYSIERQIVLSAGHTNATYDEMLEAMSLGITHATHFFNAMRKLHHRDPGVVGALLLHREISCEIIADGFHVHPSLIKLLMRNKDIDKIVMVTDALRPTGQHGGCLLANNEEVYLSNDGVFRRKGDDVIAGSSLTMDQGVENLYNFGIALDLALRMATCNPARVIGEDKKFGYLIPGMTADIAVFDYDFDVKLTLVGGVEKHNEIS
jgi:N-acetylglucosamine-6-phosphate deacetylase